MFEKSGSSNPGPAKSDTVLQAGRYRVISINMCASNCMMSWHYVVKMGSHIRLMFDDNEQVFCPKPCKKKLAQIRLVGFEKNAKLMHFNSEKMTSLCQRLEGLATLITS